MEGDRQSQGGPGGQGWYEGGAGAAHPASPMPSAQLHQVRQEPCNLNQTFYLPILKESTNESDNYFKSSSTSTASQYMQHMQSAAAYGGIQSHGE